MDPGKTFRTSTPYAKTHTELWDTGITRPEAICYARTWHSKCWCPFKPGTAGFKCTDFEPHEVFDQERKQLPFGATIPRMYIAYGKHILYDDLAWGWSNYPWIWEAST